MLINLPQPGSKTRASTGLATREVSRTLEYSHNDFAVRQAAKALGKPKDDVETYTNRSLNFKNVWDADVQYDNFTGYVQKRLEVRVEFFLLSCFFLCHLCPVT